MLRDLLQIIIIIMIHIIVFKGNKFEVKFQHAFRCRPILCTSSHSRVVKVVARLGHDEAMEAGGREFEPRPGHYSRMSF